MPWAACKHFSLQSHLLGSCSACGAQGKEGRLSNVLRLNHLFLISHAFSHGRGYRPCTAATTKQQRVCLLQPGRGSRLPRAGTPGSSIPVCDCTLLDTEAGSTMACTLIQCVSCRPALLAAYEYL